MLTLTWCPVFQEERVACVNQMKEVTVAVFTNIIINREVLVRLIIDNSVFQTKKGRKEQNLVNRLRHWKETFNSGTYKLGIDIFSQLKSVFLNEVSIFFSRYMWQISGQ